MELHVALAAGLRRAVDELPAPAYVLDRDRRFRWLNRAGRELFGERIGQLFCRVVAPEDVNAVQRQFARRILRVRAKDDPLTLIDRNGGRFRAQLVSVPLHVGDETVGVFGLALGVVDKPMDRPLPRAPAAHSLTPRQLEVLHLLSEGLETTEIAQRLGVAEHTARNHMRGVFRGLNVRSRLHAVVRAYHLGLLELEDLRGDGRR